MSVAHCLWQPSTRRRMRPVVIVIVVTLLCLYQPFGVIVGALANVLGLWVVWNGEQSNGTFRRSAPSEAVDPRTVAHGVRGELAERAEGPRSPDA